MCKVLFFAAELLHMKSYKGPHIGQLHEQLFLVSWKEKGLPRPRAPTQAFHKTPSVHGTQFENSPPKWQSLLWLSQYPESRDPWEQDPHTYFLAQIPAVISVSNFESPATSTSKREAGRFDSALRSIHEAVCFSIVESELPKLAIMTLNFFPTV